MSTTVYFCAHCQANEETLEYVEGAQLIVRCQKCGYPVEEGAVDKGHVAFQRTKVLFVDDDQLLLGFFSDFAKAHDLHIITAMADPKLSVKGCKAGATLAMHKPLETQRVFDIITTALALKLKPPTAA